MQEQTLRFSSAEWADFKEYIDIIGVGGIGSWTTLLLSKLGYRLNIFDDDVIDISNMGGQFYASMDIGLFKVLSLSKQVQPYSNGSINPNVLRVTSEYTLSKYTILGLDNMKARKVCAELWYNAMEKSNWTSNGILLDGRMNAESMEIFSITNKNQYERYMSEYMFNDDEVEDAPCSFKATPQTGMLIAAKITSFLVNYIYNTVVGERVRVVPFHYEEITPIVHVEMEEYYGNIK